MINIGEVNHVWIFRLDSALSSVTARNLFLSIFQSWGRVPDLCNNDTGGIVKFNRSRFESYTKDSPTLLVSKPQRHPLMHKELWHEVSLGQICSPYLAGHRPVLFASFNQATGLDAERAPNVFSNEIGARFNYGYQVCLPAEIHVASYACRLGAASILQRQGSVETFQTLADQNEELYAKPRNVYPEMIVMKHAVDDPIYRTFLSLHSKFGGDQSDKGAYVRLRMRLDQLVPARAAMWKAGVIVSDQITANEWLVNNAYKRF